MLKNRKESSGFTLIEILVVVAIIAILSSVILIGLGPTRKLGRDARRISDLKEMQNALELYFNKCGGYVGAANAGTGGCTNGGTFTGSCSAAEWTALHNALVTAGFSRGVPDDPNQAVHYCYGVNTNAPVGTNYVLGATLEDNANVALQQSPSGVVPNFTGPACTRGAYDTPAAAVGLYCVQL